MPLPAGNSTITGLPPYPAAIGADKLVIVDVTNNITKEISKDAFLSDISGSSGLVSSQIWISETGNIVLVRMDNTVQFTFKDLGAGAGPYVESELWINDDGRSVMVTIDSTDQFAFQDLGLGAAGTVSKFWINPDGHIIKITLDNTNQFAYEDLGI